MALLALIASIPPRRPSCERLLSEIAKQSRVPDGVILALDGYGDLSAPSCPLPVRIYRTPALSGGPGHKWRVVADCDPRDILINIDDDTMLCEAPDLVRVLVEVVERGGAAAAMGRLPDGRRAAPGPVSRGRLLYGCGCGLAVRAGHLEGLQELAAQVRAAGGPDALGPCGDDDALVSAHLWRRGVPIWHAATGNLYSAPGTERFSQTRARLARGEDLQDQKRAIAQITGWPWVDAVVEVEQQQGLMWEQELSAVPAGAIRAQGEVPGGHRRVLVLDGEEPDRSGVYDVPVTPDVTG